ncbi:uncharacterized protein LOC130429757 [Triplophysa dalaica]|uniref:uncharacterized protein LOC130429757 n=1 Tax=Triplophysa dalaica TaxID=1582913 RepID=UPI0024DF923F|nr:uncharacterized protein LOC130429757 [Triplophysa dalaica]
MTTIALLYISSLCINVVFGADPDEVKTLSVMEGDSVTLHNHFAIQNKSVLEWDFGMEGFLVAKIDREANEVSLNDDVADRRFLGRLHMDEETGDLTIINITTNHTGEYKLEITDPGRNKKTFSLNVFGDPGEVKSVSVSVMEGDYVTLHVGYPDIKNYDVIRWRFQYKFRLAEIDRKTGSLSKHGDVLDGRFRDRLEANHLSGSLTITKMRTDLSGLYEVDVNSNSGAHTIHKSYTVTVSGDVKILSVMEGEPVTLQTDLTHIQTDDRIQWMFVFDGTLIAEIYQPNYINSAYNGTDVRFKDRLNLNHQTGDLTINKITKKLSGLYELKIISRRLYIHRKITVNVSEATLSSHVIAGICVGVLLVIAAAAAGGIFCRHMYPKARTQKVMEGDTVILHTDVHVRPDNVVMEWSIGSLMTQKIAEYKNSNKRMYGDALDGRLRGRLTLRDTGSLTIKDTRTTDSGVYRLKIKESRIPTIKRFRLTVTSTLEMKFVKEGESVMLETKTEIQNKKLEWIFEDQDTPIAQIDPACNVYSTSDDGVFRDTLQLNHETGDLTINNMSEEHFGLYKLQVIANDDEISYRRFNVSVDDSNRVTEEVPLTNGDVQQQ